MKYFYEYKTLLFKDSTNIFYYVYNYDMRVYGALSYKSRVLKRKAANKTINKALTYQISSLNRYLNSYLKDFWVILPTLSYYWLPRYFPLKRVICIYFTKYELYIDSEEALFFKSSFGKRWLPFIAEERFNVIFDFLNLYLNLFLSYFTFAYFVFFKKRVLTNKLSYDNLIFFFRKSKFALNLSSRYGDIYFFLFSGFFLKFLKRQKSFKKNKLIKLVMVKTLRKFLILTMITNLFFFIKGTHFLLVEFLNVLYSPILRPFLNPFSERVGGYLMETKEQKREIRFEYIIFLESSNHTKRKGRKCGRIKRKLTRKIVKLNSLVD